MGHRLVGERVADAELDGHHQHWVQPNGLHAEKLSMLAGDSRRLTAPILLIALWIHASDRTLPRTFVAPMSG